MNTKKFFIYVFTAAALLLCGCGRKSESSVPAAAGSFEFLKVPHHGRYNSETENLIKSVMPAYSVITDSDKNPADKAVTDALKSCGSKVYFTKYGTVSVLSNGKDLKISQ